MKKLLTAILLSAGLIACVEVNDRLGGELIPTDQQYDIYTTEIDLGKVLMKSVDSLSGYSSKRITFGSIRDNTYGLFRRESAITLVPVLDSIDFGKNPRVQRFRFRVGPDSTSVSELSQSEILQNVNVYTLTKPVDKEKYYSQEPLYHDGKRASKGVPVINGKDSLVFDFTDEFASHYLTMTQDDLKDIDTYTKKFPGICLSTDDPAGNGGRINMFDMAILESSSSGSSLQRTDNYAVLYFDAEYDGVRKDSLFMFYISPLKFQNLDSLVNAVKLPSQYVFNVDYHEKSTELEGEAKDKIYLEGGSGLKPVIPASEIHDLIAEQIEERGGDPATAIISKATIILPYTFPDDYKTMYRFPVNLSPTIKIHSDSGVNYAGLTDASVSTENQGDINKSLCCYTPDITHHVQQIVRLKDASKYEKYDVWFLIMWYEKTTTYDSEAGEMADYYQQLAYYSYYNQLYGGGYGSYSSYGGYGGYSNYYSYMMMAQYASASASSTSTDTEMDKDRYYCAQLNGPESEGPKPRLKVTFAIPKK